MARIAWVGLCLAVAASGHVSAGDRTVVEAVIDREGPCTYCSAVRKAFADAATSIDLLLANAELERNPIWDDVILAHERGVHVRVMLDESEWAPSITERNRPVLDHLSERGIEVRFDDPDVTTHAKLVVVDRTTVILGSSNWNHYAFTDQEQTNIRIDDERVGEAFAEFFDRLWDDRLAAGGISLPLTELDWDGVVVVALPDTDGTANYGSLLLELFPRAARSIHVVMYRLSVYHGFSDSLANELVDQLIAAVGRGLDVRVVLDDCSFYPDSAEANLTAALYLFRHGIDVRFDEPDETTHAKLVVIDGQDVVLGSTNWNYYSLERNVEASVALLGVPQVAAIYDAYFELLWNEGRAIGP
jgi:phosphatidylserine/phosphatidylglycerophosphate/cardiolipin synthase-like enzyme